MRPRAAAERSKSRPALPVSVRSPHSILPTALPPTQADDAGLSSRFGLRWDSKYDRLLDAMGVPPSERACVVADLLAILHPVLDAYLAEVKAVARRADPPPAS